MIRGIRGATTVINNEAQEMISKSVELMEDVIKQNNIDATDVVSVLFTVTEDIDATFPAKSLRQFTDWTYVPVMCMREIPVPGSLEKCIRVLVTVHTHRDQHEMMHIYHHGAKQLRPDLKS